MKNLVKMVILLAGFAALVGCFEDKSKTNGYYSSGSAYHGDDMSGYNRAYNKHRHGKSGYYSSQAPSNHQSYQSQSSYSSRSQTSSPNETYYSNKSASNGVVTSSNGVGYSSSVGSD